MNFTDQDIEEMIQGIEDGTFTLMSLPVPYYNALTAYLEKAVYEGFKANLSTVSRLDLPLLEELVTNVYMFGAAKTFQQTAEISRLLVDDEGNVRSSREFNRIARETYDNWNNNWGETEYNTAIGQADMAAKWAEIERQKEIVPNLEYSAVMDPNTSEICAPLDGIIAPVDDPIWDKISPLNHFNCFAPGTPVLTPGGWVPIESLQVGDMVIGGSGNAQRITAIHVNTLDGEAVQVSVKGHTVTATKNHRFLTLDGWKRAENLSAGDVIVQGMKVGTLNKLVGAVKNLYTLCGYLLMPETMGGSFGDYIMQYKHRESGEGFTDGEPVAKYGNSYKLLRHSFFNRGLTKVMSCNRVKYSGPVYNLSVSNDESYTINVGVVHNCRCLLLQTTDPPTADYADVAANVIDTIPDAFRNNPGKTGEIFTKDHPYFEVSNEYRDWAKENFGLELPKFTRANEEQ